jgi:hypothetical protein
VPDGTHGAARGARARMVPGHAHRGGVEARCAAPVSAGAGDAVSHGLATRRVRVRPSRARSRGSVGRVAVVAHRTCGALFFVKQVCGGTVGPCRARVRGCRGGAVGTKVPGAARSRRDGLSTRAVEPRRTQETLGESLEIGRWAVPTSGARTVVAGGTKRTHRSQVRAPSSVSGALWTVVARGARKRGTRAPPCCRGA